MNTIQYGMLVCCAASLPIGAAADDKTAADKPTRVALGPLVQPATENASAATDSRASKGNADTGADAGTDAVEQRGQIVEMQKPKPQLFPLKFGMDSYSGITNVPGRRSLSDGIWAGSAPVYPSTSFLRWDNGAGSAAKVAVGLGQMYTGSSVAVKQPVEAWWQVPAGKASLTVGKFWVPFAQQEWQYESKPGLMLNWTEGPHSLAVSTNYNENVRSVNSYLRFERSFGQDAGAGISFAYGRGLTFDSGHDKALGLDATFAIGGFRFFGEYTTAMRMSSDAFTFLSGKVQYERMGLWKPFMGTFMWNDRGGAFGRFRSSVYGMAYQITPGLSVEGGVAPTTDRRVSWLQLHWGWER